MRFPVLLWLLLSGVHVFAQHKWAVGGMYLPGFLYAHTDDAKNLEAHVQGIEVSVSKINNQNKYWSRYYKKSEIGYRFMYMDLGQPDLTGKVFALGTHFQFKIAGNNTRYLSLRLGTGVGYVTRKFDFYNNRKNMAMGSNVNGEIQMALIYQVPVGKHVHLKTGLGFTHYSNGSIRVPNLGINMPSLFVGMHSSFSHSQVRLADSTDDFKVTGKKHELLLNYAFKERFTAKPISFHIVSAGYRWLKKISPVRRWYLGSDLVWDPTHPYSHDLKNPNPRVGIDNSTELGVLIGHRYDIGRFGLLTDVGFYLLNPYQTKYFTYQRIGFRYEINNNWFANATLKVHFGTADYFEWGLGYKFNYRKK